MSRDQTYFYSLLREGAIQLDKCRAPYEIKQGGEVQASIDNSCRVLLSPRPFGHLSRVVPYDKGDGSCYKDVWTGDGVFGKQSKDR